MAPRTAKTAAVQEAIDDESYFMNRYQQLTKNGKERAEAKRAKLRRDHAARVQTLRAKIAAVTEPQKVSPSAASAVASASTLISEPGAERQQTGSLEYRRAQLHTLRALLMKKKAIENRIFANIDNLEKAYHQTSREIKAGLLARVEEMEVRKDS